jgi:hypothetical protein
MRIPALALGAWIAVQAMPATVQIYPPTEAPATIRVGAGGDLQAASTVPGPATSSSWRPARRSPATSC